MIQGENFRDWLKKPQKFSPSKVLPYMVQGVFPLYITNKIEHFSYKSECVVQEVKTGS